MRCSDKWLRRRWHTKQTIYQSSHKTDAIHLNKNQVKRCVDLSTKNVKVKTLSYHLMRPELITTPTENSLKHGVSNIYLEQGCARLIPGEKGRSRARKIFGEEGACSHISGAGGGQTVKIAVLMAPRRKSFPSFSRKFDKFANCYWIFASMSNCLIKRWILCKFYKLFKKNAKKWEIVW